MKKNLFLLFAVSVTSFLSGQAPQINLVQLATGYASPTDIKTCGDQRLFIVEQPGYIRILYKNGTKQTTPFLNIDAEVNNAQDEQGLLGLAFSPNYKQDGFFYVQYTTGPGVDSIRISRFHVMAGDSTQADPSSERVLISYHDIEWNHNGGNLMFGPDGYLYATEGDGGSGGDPDASHGVGGNGQNKNVFFGKMLRIDVTNQTSYAIPPTNPFVGIPNTKPEIWAYGLRNAWRCAFDRITGDMWIADVGQDTYEEVDFQPSSSTGGENYGWRCREGMHNFNTTNCGGTTGLIDPIYEYTHSNGCSITGGYAYRGTQYSKLFGLYIFADYCLGTITSIQHSGNSFTATQLGDFANYQYTSFGQDNLGELYIAYRGSPTGTTGRIYKLVETSNCNPVAFISFKDSVEGCSPVALNALKGDTLTYQWYNSNGIINGASSYQFPAQQSGWYKVKVSKQQVGCEAMSDSIYVTVFDTTALVKNNVDSVYCISEAPFSLNGFYNATPGAFSGNGVANDDSTFSPASAGVGIIPIQYSYTNVQGCISSASFNLEVADATTLTKNVTTTFFCTSDLPVSLTSYVSPAGGTFFGNAITNNNFDPSSAPLGFSTIVYQYTNNSGCISTDSFQLEVSICTGIETKSESLAFNIFPNPAKGKVNLEVKVNSIQQAELTITDAVGEICFRKNQLLDPNKPIISLELPQLAKGVYSLQLKGEKGSAVKSLAIE